MKIKGFTLAEILITLAIIGVVATLTIPGTIKNYRNKVLTTQLQNTINLVATAVSQAMEDNAAENFSNLISSTNLISNFLEKYFDTVNICDSVDNIGNCLSAKYSSFDGTMNFSTTINFIDNSTTRRCAALTSGATICVARSGNFETHFNDIIIDINGLESPNVTGKDFFRFYVLDNGKLSYSGTPYYEGFKKVMDENAYNDYISTSVKSEQNGTSCSTSEANPTFNVCLPYIISHGWKFKF